MSDLVFPALPGLAWNVVRTPVWQTRTQISVSGRETRQADWSYPRYNWELSFDFLRSEPAIAELQTLIGFINQLQGGFASFLYSDDDDQTVTGQLLGEGDGAATTFALVREFGGFIEPVSRVNAVQSVTVAGAATPVAVSHDAGIESGSSIIFASPPAAGAAITASFTYYWRCRMLSDTTDFTKFLYGLSSASSLKFESVK